MDNVGVTSTDRSAHDGDRTYEVIKETKVLDRIISWRAILAGVAVTIVAQMLFTILGMGIGLAIVNPLRDQNPGTELGVGSVIWWSVTMLTSLFLGGWTTGKLYSVTIPFERTMHGLLTWSVFTIFSFLMITTSAGILFSGLGNYVGASAKPVATNPMDISPISYDVRNVILQHPSGNYNYYDRNSKMNSANDTSNYNDYEDHGSTVRNTRYENDSRRGKTVNENAGYARYVSERNDYETGGRELSNSNSAMFVNSALDIFQYGDPENPEVRQSMINSLKAQTGMSEQEASARVDKWIASYRDLKEQAKVKATQSKQSLAIASIVFFFALVLGATVTIAGTRTARPDVVAPVAV